VKRHDYPNLIALCPNCHDRYDRGEIDRKSMLQYKANLSTINSQYGDVERRIIEMFGVDEDASFLRLPSGFKIFVWNLLRDGYLERIGQVSSIGFETDTDDFLHVDVYRLTPAGREFVSAYTKGTPLARGTTDFAGIEMYID